MLSDAARTKVKADRELLLFRLQGKNTDILFLKEIDIFVCKKLPSIYDLTLKAAVLEKGRTTLV